MKWRTTREHELRSAEDTYRHGPQAGLRLWPFKAFMRPSDGLHFSDRFVFIYFLVLVILIVLGVMAMLSRSGAKPAIPVQSTVMYLERSRA